jgi:hypothetical protein
LRSRPIKFDGSSGDIEGTAGEPPSLPQRSLYANEHGHAYLKEY